MKELFVRIDAGNWAQGSRHREPASAQPHLLGCRDEVVNHIRPKSPGCGGEVMQHSRPNDPVTVVSSCIK